MKNSEHTLSCCRCGESIESQLKPGIQLSAIVILTSEEEKFIRLKFRDPLCAACLNQLKTSYRIGSGHYTISLDNNVSN